MKRKAGWATTGLGLLGIAILSGAWWASQRSEGSQPSLNASLDSMGGHDSNGVGSQDRLPSLPRASDEARRLQDVERDAIAPAASNSSMSRVVGPVLEGESEPVEAESWTARVSVNATVIPGARFERRRRGAGAEILRADASGVLHERLSTADWVSLLVPEFGGASDRRVPCRLDASAAGGPALWIDLLAVIVVHDDGDPALGDSGDVGLLLPEELIHSDGQLFEQKLAGWRAGPEQFVFAVVGSGEIASRSDEDSFRVGVRAGSKVVGEIRIPWPCWAPHGSFEVLRPSMELAALTVELEAPAGETDPEEEIQVTLHRVGSGGSSLPIGFEFCTTERAAEFPNLETGPITIYLNSPSMSLLSFQREIQPGANHVVLPLAKPVERIDVDVVLRFAGQRAPDDIRVTAEPVDTSRGKMVDVPVPQTHTDEATREVTLTLTPGLWNVSAYSAHTGALYGQRDRVSPREGSVRFEVNALGDLVPVRLADELESGRYEFWLDMNGRGLRKLTSALPGQPLAEIHEFARSGFWVLVHPTGRLHCGRVEALPLRSGEPRAFVLGERPTWSAGPLVRVARVGVGGVEALVLSSPTGPTGYVEGLAGLEEVTTVVVGGEPVPVLGQQVDEWLTTVWIE